MQLFNISNFWNISIIMKLIVDVIYRSVVHLINDIGWIGLLALTWGLLCSLRKKDVLGRDLLVFWFLVGGLVICRGINSNGFVSTRMLVPLNYVSIFIIICGLETLWKFLEGRSNPRATRWPRLTESSDPARTSTPSFHPWLL